MSDFDKAHIKEILNGLGNCFGARLLRLIHSADAENREKLRRGFPEEVDAYLDYIGDNTPEWVDCQMKWLEKVEVKDE